MNTIYVLVVIGSKSYTTRSWGWFPTLAQAEECVRDEESNDLIFESGTFQWAIIEEVPPGFMGGAADRKTWWFEAEFLGHNDNQGPDYKIEALDEAPEEFHGTISFGMG
jgi:hypothetical protein